MNAATAQMVTLTGQGNDTDHNAVGAAVNTISTNLPDMAREVKMLAALMDDKGVEGDDLMGAARTLCGAFSDMLKAAEPETNEVIDDEHDYSNLKIFDIYDIKMLFLLDMQPVVKARVGLLPIRESKEVNY